jgi:hypothetical protein
MLTASIVHHMIQQVPASHFLQFLILRLTHFLSEVVRLLLELPFVVFAEGVEELLDDFGVHKWRLPFLSELMKDYLEDGLSEAAVEEKALGGLPLHDLEKALKGVGPIL